jgi:hypothetical protein
MQSSWIRKIWIVALVGGLCLANYALGVSSADADTPSKEGPFAGVTQNWDKNLPSASRFTFLADFGGAAVRDNNTGLVWERAPDNTTRVWVIALQYCINKNVGGNERLAAAVSGGVGESD